MFSLIEEFVDVPSDKAANNLDFICQSFYVSAIINELNLDSQLSNQENNKIHTFINNDTRDKKI